MAQVRTLTSVGPSLTPSNQAGSRFLMIPAEIRLIVLRQLLKCDKPIYSLSSSDDVEYLESIQRSAQLLCTCQLLHREGLPILYEENTLCIDFMDFDPESGEETVHFCGILQMYLPIPEKLSGSEEELLALIDYATEARAISHDETGLMRQSAETLVMQWDTLQKFSRFQIRIQYATQPTVFSACRLLSRLLNNKDVKFTLDIVDDEEEYRVPEIEFDKSAAQMLASCRFLRCKSTAFEKQNFVLAVLPKPSAVENVEELTAVITGGDPISDVYLEWVSTRQRLSRFFDAEGQGEFEEDYEENLRLLQQAAMDYDQVAYKDKMQIFISKLKEDITNDANDRIALCENEEDAFDLREELNTKIASIEERFGRNEKAL